MPVDDVRKMAGCLYRYIVKNFGGIFAGDLLRDCNGIICWKYGGYGVGDSRSLAKNLRLLWMRLVRDRRMFGDICGDDESRFFKVVCR